MKKVILILFINLAVLNNIAFPSDKKNENYEEEREREIEKAIFMAAGSQNRVLRINMIDCIANALKNNSEIKIERIEPRLKENDIKIAKADFEPGFSVEALLEDTKEHSASALGASTTRTGQFNAGINGKIITGTEYEIELNNKRYKSDSRYQMPNPYYSSDMEITITQPLLKDFGILINRADIIIAQNNKTSSHEDFKNTVMDILTKTKVAYYNYVFYLENYDIAKLSLERAKDLLEINKGRYAKGLVSSVDLLETETASLQREKDLIAGESSLKKAEDELKLITGLVDDPELWNAKLELIDMPEFTVREISLLESLENAFKFRPDYLSERIELKNRNIEIKVAKNALFPTMDLVGSFGLNGLGKDYEQCIEKIDKDYKSWGVGIELNIPWGGEERAEYDKRKLEKAQALISFKRLEQDIILEVRDKVREVDMQSRQLQAAKISKEKENKNYEAQKERYADGQVSTHDMLDYQDKLARAELDYIKALIDCNIAIINLDKSEGLTLVRNDVIMEE